MFLKHTSCDRCGSSDARALYKGGSSFCFSCRSGNRSSISPYIFDEALSNSLSSELNETKLPSDISFNYPEHCLAWVFNYGVSIDELIKNKVYWSEEKQQLIFTFWNGDECLLWQARNFGTSEWAKRVKYYTKGKPDNILPIYGQSHRDVDRRSLLVLVEDCLSAIKISRQCLSMPVLGSDLSQAKLTRLSRVLEASGGIVVWLDGNMYTKAQRMASRLQMLGVEARALYTEHDPKTYSNEKISMLLQNSC